MVRDTVSKAEGKYMNKLANKMKKRLNFGPSQPSVTTQVKKLKQVVNQMKPEVKYVANITLADNVQVAGTGLKYDGVLNTNGWVNAVGSNPLIPALVQGVSENQRVGNYITPKKLIVKYSLYANPSTESGSTPNNNPYITLPFYARVIIYRHRYATDDFSQNGILDLGATNGDISGNLEGLYEPYNRDEYTIVHSKTYLMQPQRHQLTGSGSFTGQNQDQRARTVVIKRCKVPLPKRMRYNDGSSVPSGEGYFIAVCCVNSDGSWITNSGATVHQRLRLTAESYMTFTDS